MGDGVQRILAWGVHVFTACGAVAGTFMLTFLGGFTQPHAWRAAYVARSAGTYPRIAFNMGLFNGAILPMVMIAFAGVTLHLVFATPPAGVTADNVLITVTKQMSPWLALFASLGLAGAMMSTATLQDLEVIS